MKERPILMHARSIKGILEGRKTQTRRIIKDSPIAASPNWSLWYDKKMDTQLNQSQFAKLRCPYGSPGDRLWVRETWAVIENRIVYRADNDSIPEKWSPSIHMFRDNSRLTLEVTDIRVERVQDISEVDAKDEGVWTANPEATGYYGPRNAFSHLWDETNGKGAWDRNDWVWVVTFKNAQQI